MIDDAYQSDLEGDSIESMAFRKTLNEKTEKRSNWTTTNQIVFRLFWFLSNEAKQISTLYNLLAFLKTIISWQNTNATSSALAR